jgi:hypothetical protein
MADTLLGEKFLSGLTPFNNFARAIGKHPQTLAKMRPPIVRVGRTIYVPNELGHEWLLAGCPPVLPEAPAARGRRRTS